MLLKPDIISINQHRLIGSFFGTTCSLACITLQSWWYADLYNNLLAQFFINSEANTNLDHTNTTQRGWGYTVFGKVIKGEEIVDAISQVRTGAGGPFGRDVPAEPIVITSTKRITDLQSETSTAIDADANADPIIK